MVNKVVVNEVTMIKMMFIVVMVTMLLMVVVVLIKLLVMTISNIYFTPIRFSCAVMGFSCTLLAQLICFPGK